MATPRPRILLVNTSGVEARGIMEQSFSEFGAIVDEVALIPAAGMLQLGHISPTVRLVSELPSSERFDCLIVTGSPLGVRICDDEDIENADPVATLGATEAMETAVRQFHQCCKPVLGICLGSQLVARAFGGAVRKLPRDEQHTSLPISLDGEPTPPLGVEFGWLEQAFTGVGWQDPLIGKALRETISEEHMLSSGKLEFKFQQWHGDTFDLPTDAVALSTRPQCPSQIFRVGNEYSSTYAFQCHIEVGQSVAQTWARYFAEGRDVYKPSSEWNPLRTFGARESLMDNLNAEIQKGTVRRAESFTLNFMRNWLGRALSRRQNDSIQAVCVASCERSRSRSPIQKDTRYSDEMVL